MATKDQITLELAPSKNWLSNNKSGHAAEEPTKSMSQWRQSPADEPADLAESALAAQAMMAKQWQKFLWPN